MNEPKMVNLGDGVTGNASRLHWCYSFHLLCVSTSNFASTSLYKSMVLLNLFSCNIGRRFNWLILFWKHVFLHNDFCSFTAPSWLQPASLPLVPQHPLWDSRIILCTVIWVMKSCCSSPLSAVWQMSTVTPPPKHLLTNLTAAATTLQTETNTSTASNTHLQTRPPRTTVHRIPQMRSLRIRMWPHFVFTWYQCNTTLLMMIVVVGKG